MSAWIGRFLAVCILWAACPAVHAQVGLPSDWIARGAAYPLMPTPPRPGPRVRAVAGDSWVVVEMANGGSLVFDNYQIEGGANTVTDRVNAMYLAQMRGADTFRARLNPRELAILDKVKIVSIDSSKIEASAEEEAGEYTINVSNGLGYFTEIYGLVRANNLGDEAGLTEELSLLIGSEFDSQQGRNRWYWPSLMAWYKGRPIRNNTGINNLGSVYKQVAMRAMFLHELCHHFAGHSSIDARAARAVLLQGDAEQRDKYKAVTQAQELQADHCAAGHLAASGAEPGDVFYFLLLTDFLRTSDDPDHPSIGQRVKALSDFTDRAMEQARADGVPQSEIDKYRASFKALEKAQIDNRGLDAFLQRLPRGAWPQCPFAPDQQTCTAP